MTKEMQPEALRLADALAYCDSSVASQAAAELRRLHARVEELEGQRKPLTDEQINDALSGIARWQFPAESRSKDYDRAAARAIERAHGIGEVA